MHGEMSRQRTLISLWSSQPAPSDGTVANNDSPSKRGRSVEELQHEYESQFSIFKRKRAVYNDEQKRVVYNVLKGCEHNCNKAHAVLTKSGVQVGYKTVWRINEQMKNGRASRARGRPIDHDFERALLTKVIVQVLDKGLNQDGSILGNIMHSLRVIVIAGLDTAREENFRDRQLVKGLKFSLCSRRSRASTSSATLGILFQRKAKLGWTQQDW